VTDTTTGWDEVAVPARPYYDRLATEEAVLIAKEMCAEWSYAEDPHGYCHTRSVLVALIAAVENRP
jgi:hypothetical protein